ncbi:tRNA lysidine(34) synthetase TilS [Photobacterium galatheae]|uniref:tRNA(Ile)-lysidine synthase n=1 Tax=Photobacterium galatheae TaxID=1654360 RepID=A0A066RP89_9GAMM|nr:tRNA lysidine(34) synthetase TilS [Photobacterium galatheae]KDM90946.1 hypothetical protein EA58_14420 [Photobacterium galatheae]MCM0149089.1 tRNA lysidine(34) synthetase TilS [Photobacterium galatheae]
MTLFSQETQAALIAHDEFVVGLSGGVDSVVALDCMNAFAKSHASPLKVRAIHVHHGFSDNADNWHAFCQAVCDKYGIPLTTLKVKVDGSKNLEANARQARYRAIKNNLSSSECLITGHHEDDQAETILLALKRGTGLDGLCGMAQFSIVHEIPIFRPLLSVSRDEIEAYAQQLNLEWIEDESNTDTRFDRNYLRLEILPRLKERWPAFSRTVGRTAQMCQHSRELTEHFAETDVQRVVAQGFLSLADIQSKPSSYQFYILREWFKRCGIAPQALARMREIERAVIGSRYWMNPKLELSKGVWLHRKGDKIYLSVDKSAGC